MHKKISQVTERVHQLIEKSQTLFGVDLNNVQIRFDLKGQAAGMAGIQFGKMFVRFNVQMMQNDSWDHIFNSTIAHEIAHLVCYAKPQLGRNHDYGWRRVCLLLGGNGQRTHDEQVTFAKGRTYAYTTTLGQVVRISEQRHRKIQNGCTYRMQNGGQLTSQCHYELVN